MELVKQLEKLEDIISKHKDLMEKESRSLISEYSISSAQKAQKELNKIEDENRLLQIGIVGRVKAGKSSLLNAFLFEGKSILPKAATPMTAALTVISYGKTLSAEIEFFKQEDIIQIEHKYQEYLEELKILKKKKYDNLLQKLTKKKDKNNSDQNNKNESIVEKSRKALNESKFAKRINSSEFGKTIAYASISERKKIELEEKAEKSAHNELQKNIDLSASYDQYNRIKASGIDTQLLKHQK
ncbi:MAG TPA: hypothetical protein ENK66_06890 [Arcobacter sp.]|nr:hypothetical protein [Arcobacter sp.]